MRLDRRLRLLRGETGQPPPAPAKGDLVARLQRLAPKGRRIAPDKVPDELSLVESLGAEHLAPGLLRVQRSFPLDSCHGSARLGDCLSALPDLVNEPAGHPSGWLFLDTETSGLAGGSGTWAFLCGLLRVEPQGMALHQYLLTRLDAEGPYLEAIASELKTARLLVTYNGKCFDGPLLATRFRLAGLSNALDDKLHLDLLHLMRRAFSRTWPDCRLVTAEKRLLGLERKGDLPGAEAPKAWLAWLRRGETEGLCAVIRHNRWDLMSLPAVVPPLKRGFVDPVAIHGYRSAPGGSRSVCGGSYGLGSRDVGSRPAKRSCDDV